MSRPELCVGGVARRRDQLLMVQRGQEPSRGYWSIPGGRVERGETIPEAVVRELAEETGLAVVCGPLLGWVERITEEHHVVILDFEVTVIDDAEPEAGADAEQVAWVPVGELSDLPVVDGLIEFLADVGVVDTLT